MGRSTDGTDGYASGFANEQPEHTATVDSFQFDKYEVTVGRFRKFVAAYNGGAPAAGAGDHHGLGAGWQSSWNSSLPATQAALITNLKCSSVFQQTWTDSAGGNENAAINCVDWYEAFAFCVWDGGRLPTEAEWEYAAAGGSENRLYPWGSTDPGVSTALANDYYSGGSPFQAVGSHPTGAGKWGHQDLAGGTFEWAFDWSGAYSANTCSNCANVTSVSARVLRGGSWLSYNSYDDLRAAYRFGGSPTNRDGSVGFRCVR